MKARYLWALLPLTFMLVGCGPQTTDTETGVNTNAASPTMTNEMSTPPQMPPVTE